MVRWEETEFMRSATTPEHYPPNDMPEIALVGRSNVGKSALLNALCNRKNLARVSQQPGRTQVINFYQVKGPLRLVDLPGYGYAKVSKAVREAWGPMIEAYLRDREALAGVVHIIDSRHPPSEDDRLMQGWLQAYNVPTLVVATKSDKLSTNERVKQKTFLERELERPVLFFSSHTKDGRDELIRQMLEIVDRHKQASPRQ